MHKEIKQLKKNNYKQITIRKWKKNLANRPGPTDGGE